MQLFDRSRHRLDDAAFRAALQGVVTRSGRSMRSVSLAMGRDPGYVAALLDPSRPSRARPTPDDLLALSDATGIPLVALLETLWAIPMDRLADEFAHGDRAGAGWPLAADLTSEDRETVAALARFLGERRRARPGRRRRGALGR